MATAKKTAKSDVTDKKSNTTKKTTTTKKKATAKKKKVESTGVVDEFLNENIGKVATETETPKPEKKTTTTEKTDENKLIDAEAELNEILSQQITEENARAADEIEKTISEQKELVERWEKLGLNEGMEKEASENLAEIYKQQAANLIVEVEKESEDCTDIPIAVPQIEVKKEEGDKPQNVVYPPVQEEKKEADSEGKKGMDVEGLKVKLQPKPNQFTYVKTSMGVNYDE